MKYFPEKLSFTWIKKVYKSGELTPSELIDEVIRRAQTYSQKNVWIIPPSKEFCQSYIEGLAEKDKNLPLWGIPFAIKDNIDLAGVPTTAACPDYKYTPADSATVVAKLIEAGAIPVGKTNLDQFATGLVGTRSPYGEAHNAYDDQLISGGSSSGSAVSVALGMAAFALGTDTAGSGRVPAMLNCLVGFKPALGSWSTKGVVPACASLDCVTVFANSLEDAYLVDESARGFDGECPYSKEYCYRENTLPSKIYIPKDEPEFFGINEELHKSKWEKAIARIRNMGETHNISVEEIDYKMFYDAALILYEGAYVAERWADLGEFVEKNPGKTFEVTEKILRSGGTEEKTAARLFEDMHKLAEYRGKAKQLLKDAVMIMPTAGGTYTRDAVREDPIKTNSKMGLYTNHCNLLDLMAIAIPEDSFDRNLPFGITAFGNSDSSHIVKGFAKCFMESEYMRFAVCGLHKKGFSLESQLVELGADYEETRVTSPNYGLYELKTNPVKPGLVRVGPDQGESIVVDIYHLPRTKAGVFLERVKSPLEIGTIELSDNTCVKGFLCEEYAVEGCKRLQKEFLSEQA